MSQSKNLSYEFGSLTLQSYESLNGSRITNLGDPIQLQDATTKNYVDSKIRNSNLSGGVGISITNNNINVNPYQAQITAIGSIQTGTWTAGVIGIPYGGSGQTSYTANKILWYSGNNSLSSAQQLTFDTNIFNSSVPIFISNTNDITNLNDTSGSLVILGGVLIKKQLNVIGNTLIQGNITVGNLTINGNISLASINAINAIYTNVTSGSINTNTLKVVSNIVSPLISSNNLLVSNSTISNIVGVNVNLSNIQNTNMTTTNIISSGVSIFNSINATNISVGTLNVTNTTTTNLVMTNISGSSLRASAFINALNLINTYATISNLVSPYIQCNSVANVNIGNITTGNITNINNINISSVNSTKTNLLANNISSSNLNITNTINSTSFSGSSLWLSNVVNVPNSINTNNININSTSQNSIIILASIGSLRVSGITNIANITLSTATASNLFVNNYLTSTFNNFVGVTVGNLNCTSFGFFSTINSSGISTGTLQSYLSLNSISTIGTLNVTNNINNSNGTLFSNNISASNIYSTQNLISNNSFTSNSTISNLKVDNVSILGSITSVNLNSGTISVSGILSSLQNVNTNQTNVNLLNTNFSSASIKIGTSSIGNSYIINSTISNNVVINSSVSSIMISGNSIFNKNILINSSYSGGVIASAGSFLNVLPSYYTNNTSLSGSSVNSWFGNYIASSTLIASNPIITNKATNFYVQSNVIIGANQTINYNSAFSIGYTNNNTGGNLNYQLAFERSDNNPYSGIYTENSTNKLVIVNASINSGINLFTTINSSITLSNVPSSTNITPTPYIQFNTSTSNFYSTVEATNSSTASLILQGGLTVNKTILANNGLAINYQTASPTNGNTVIISPNVSGLVLTINTSLSNLTLTLPIVSITDGKILFVTTNQNITNLTLNNTILASTSISISTAIRFIYVSSQNIWYSI